MVRETALAHRKQGLDGVLHTLLNLSLVEDTAEALENGVQALRRELLKDLKTGQEKKMNAREGKNTHNNPRH